MLTLIDFSIPPEEMYKEITKQIETNKEQLMVLKSIDEPSFDTFIIPIEKQENKLSKMWSLASHLQSVKNKEDVRPIHKDTQDKLSAHYSALGFDQELMKLYEEISQQELSKDQRTVITKSLLNFKLSGVNLADDLKEALFKDRQELSQLTTKFSENVLDSSDKWILSTNDKELVGLNENQKGYLKQLAKDHQVSSDYAIGLDGPSYIMILNYCENRELREKVYKAYAKKAGPSDEVSIDYDNTKIASRIIELRNKIANTLGFESYLEYSLASKFAESPSDVQTFLDILIKQVKPKAEKERKDLEDFVHKLENHPDQLQPWDIGFYSQKLKKEKLNYNEEELRQFFPATHVINKMFETFGALYNFSVQKREDITTWDESVNAYELIDNTSKKTIGFLYSDLYARPKKRGGAWMSDSQSFVNYHDWTEKPIANLVCNFQKGDQPTLTFSDVETLFHEFGHSLHHLLTQRAIPSIAGINEVAWDIVELPSQLQEQWCWDRNKLRQLSKNIESGEPLSEEQIDKIIESRHFQASLHLIRQLEFASYDWSIHSLASLEDPVSHWKELRKNIAVYPTYQEHVFPLSFSHIFAGGYAAGYYSYLWAETYAHQVYFFMKENNFSQSVTQGFLESFLAKGGDENLRESLHKYLGEKQKVEPLLESYGVIE